MSSLLSIVSKVQEKGQAGHWALAFFAALAAFVLFIPALGGEFVDWDDPLYVFDNEPLLQGSGLGYVWWVFSNYYAMNYHPLTMVSFYIDYKVWGLNPLGFHMTSVVVHSLNSAILYFVVYKFLTVKKNFIEVNFGDRSLYIIPFVTAVIFAIHPGHVESVAWVSGRKDLFCLFFYLASIYSYLIYIDEKSYKHFSFAVLSLVVALLFKPMAVSLPVVLILIDLYFKRYNRETIKTIVLDKVWFVVPSLAIIYLVSRAQIAGASLNPVGLVSIETRIHTALYGYGYYLKQFLFPSSFAPLHPLPLNTSLAEFKYGFSLFAFFASHFETEGNVVDYRTVGK